MEGTEENVKGLVRGARGPRVGGALGGYDVSALPNNEGPVDGLALKAARGFPVVEERFGSVGESLDMT